MAGHRQNPFGQAPPLVLQFVGQHNQQFVLNHIAPNPPIRQPLIDITQMSRTGFGALLAGPHVRIVVGNVIVDAIPIRLLLAVSEVYHKQYEEDPSRMELQIRQGVDIFWVGRITQWLRQVYHRLGSPKLDDRKLPDGANLEESLRLCQAADYLGMRQYSGWIMDPLWGLYNWYSAKYPELEIIERVALDQYDGLLLTVAKQIAYNMVMDRIDLKDLDELEAFLKEHQLLKRVVDNKVEAFRESKQEKDAMRAARLLQGAVAGQTRNLQEVPPQERLEFTLREGGRQSQRKKKQQKKLAATDPAADGSVGRA
ncbi:hypothetical protein EJ04DRAFT_516349 [Polyplosphaeria fusca]|uniref:Uncharacterized protein n=1 Tax=Polyplosphaeria fusca TaxID=682080 RepID=A0A9P4QQ27_9PLEO|nr:hypothetical protein EJ04DRAFT_516349 [Polyplosphaeria fusca]